MALPNLAGRRLKDGLANGMEREGGGAAGGLARASPTAPPQTDSAGKWLECVTPACIDAGSELEWRTCDRIAVPEFRRSPYGSISPPAVAYLRFANGTAAVVKGGGRYGTELCAAEIASKVGVRVPPMRLVSQRDQEYSSIRFALERLCIAQVEWHGEVVHQLLQEKHLLVEQYVPGHPLEGMTQPEVARTLCSAQGEFMVQLGGLMAFDLVLNGSRFPTLPTDDDEGIRQVELASVLVDKSNRLWSCENLGALTAETTQRVAILREVEKVCASIATRKPHKCRATARVVAGLRKRVNLPALDVVAGGRMQDGFIATSQALASLSVDDYRAMVQRAVDTVGDVVGILDEPLSPPLDAELMGGVSAVFRRFFS
eukprot:COSAG02_NODE_1612_length_11675_cov_29.558310_10_plen_372_part_00